MVWPLMGGSHLGSSGPIALEKTHFWSLESFHLSLNWIIWVIQWELAKWMVILNFYQPSILDALDMRLQSYKPGARQAVSIESEPFPSNGPYRLKKDQLSTAKASHRIVVLRQIRPKMYRENMDTFVKMLEASSASAFWTMSTATSCIEQVIAVINFMTFACAGKKNYRITLPQVKYISWLCRLKALFADLLTC